jgi:hypothetical protein
MMIKIWHLATFLLLAACNASPNPAAKPIITIEVANNADSTRTVARKVNGLLEGRTLVYQPTGEIAAILYFHRDSSEGIQRSFYPNGRLMRWQKTHHGQPHGDSYDFLANGNLAHIEHFNLGQRVGCNLWFYDDPRNQLHTEVELLTVAGKEWQNGYAEYDSLGQVVVRTGFLWAHAERDTIALGDSLTLRLRIRYPEHPLVAVVTADFDADFRLHDPTSLRRQMGRNHALTLRVPAQQRGQQVVRGYVADFQETKPGSPNHRHDGGRRLYFAYHYFVQ